MSTLNKISLFSPAKVNLFLAITGTRPDRYHDLVSLAAPLTFGDQLSIEFTEEDRFICNDSSIPKDSSNLILKALEIFRATHSFKQKVTFTLDKRTPTGAGLGGGSSNGTFALRGINELLGNPLDQEQLLELAAQLGSDCPLFLYDEPIIMRGRGEQINTLEEKQKKALKGLELLIFKPNFSINTKWAYDKLREGQHYTNKNKAEEELSSFLNSIEDQRIKGFNSFEAPIFKKYLALPTLVKELQEKFLIDTLLSGSGSACICFLKRSSEKERVVELIKSCLGSEVFIQSAELL